jgi:hypothetical protein
LDAALSGLEVRAVVPANNRRSETAATEMKIRDAIEADLPGIIEIYNATVSTRIVTAELEPTTVKRVCRGSANIHPTNIHSG